jgi:L-fucose mutarotase
MEGWKDGRVECFPQSSNLPIFPSPPLRITLHVLRFTVHASRFTHHVSLKEVSMLKGIPNTISPDLMHALMSMGHGDELVLADGNFPAASHAQRLIRADGLDVCTLLEGIIKFFPLDTFVDDPAVVMAVVDATAPDPPIWNDFQRILKAAEGDWVKLTPIERHAFYARARGAYCVVATSETALYANLILKKGVVSSGK